MNPENIFLDVDRWTHHSHSSKELEALKNKASPDQIKNYFLHKSVNGSILKRISSRQMDKMEENLRSLKIKMIFKDKNRKLNIHKKTEPGGADI